jgi:hypothetical protein
MNEQDKILKRILEIYAKDYFPWIKMRVRDIKSINGRYYLIHNDSSTIISLLPPIQIDDTVGKKT